MQPPIMRSSTGVSIPKDGRRAIRELKAKDSAPPLSPRTGVPHNMGERPHPSPAFSYNRQGTQSLQSFEEA